MGTEVGNKFVEPTLKEIHHEFEVLQNDLVPDDELEMVRNYLLGNLLTSLDGPLNVGDVIKTLVVEGLPYDNFELLVHEIQNIDAQRIRDLSQQYLDKKSMWEVVVGASNP